MNAVVVDTSPQLRPAQEGVPQDWLRLAEHLARYGMELSLGEPPRQFAGGLANLNYLLMIDGRETVLRRPPPGKLPPGAYDMGREFGILKRVSKGFHLAPEAIHLCDDPEVLGAPFQIIEYRRGFAVRSDVPQALAGMPDVGHCLANTMIKVLVELHSIDTEALGLGDLGRPQGFLQRSVEGWSKRALIATEGATSPLIPELTGWMRKHHVPDGPFALLHNDIKLDNILLDGNSLAPVAVLDWDQSTRGDALFDLATTLSYWTEAGDPPAMHTLRQMPTAQRGFPTREEAAMTYAKAMGRDLSDFRFYRVLAMFKLAVIFHQLHARYKQGATQDPRYAAFGELADGILEFTHTVAKGDVF
ncbi:MAG TPA: phosphotransferase family protein [Noviherbaspirillum sp.]